MKSISKFSAIFMAAVLTGCGTIVTGMTSTVFEIHDYSAFSVRYLPSTSPPEVRLEGMAWHSAMGIYKIETRQMGKTLQVITYGALVNSFEPVERFIDYTLRVPDSVETISFGNKNTIIFDRRTDYPCVSAWRFGKEVLSSMDCEEKFDLCPRCEYLGAPKKGQG